MYEPTQDDIWAHSIDLAREADFDLGLLRVRPARCEVEWDGGSRTLQRRVMQVLVALAHARGTVVSQDDLIIRCWRGLSVSDDAIYRCISLLRKLGADYPEPPFTIEAIPGVGYRLESPRQAEEEPSAARPSPNDRFRLGPFAAAASLAALVLLVGALLLVRGGALGTSQPIRVTVQHFDTLNDSGAARSLARRIPNEVVNELGDGQIETVLEEKAAPATAKRQPGLLVTGLLRDDSRHVIVDVRVEDSKSRAAIWSMEFRRDRGESSDLAPEVAARVADIVNMAIYARTAEPPLTDPSSLSALLQTTDMIRDAHGGTWAQMVENAQALVARHPRFSFGRSVLGEAYAEASDSIAVPAHAQAMRDAARRQANLALKLDPQNASAYAVLYRIEPTFNYATRERILLRGIRSARHPKEPLGALYSYQGTLLTSVGRLREALSYQLIARATDEWGPPKTAKLALSYANLGDLPAARRWLRTAVQRWPNHSGVRAARLHIAGFHERPAEGLAAIDAIDAAAAPNEGLSPVWRSFIEARAARSKRVTEAAIHKIRAAADDGKIDRETEIMMLEALGQTRLALAAANLALDRRQLEPRFLFAPFMDGVRRDPGFVGLAARVGLVTYWRETGKRPDFCRGPETSGDCPTELLAALQPAG